MRSMRFALPLLLLVSAQGFGQQYSEGTCLMLQHQIDRFAAQPQNMNYRTARREYDRYCQNPVTPEQQQATASKEAAAAAARAVAKPAARDKAPKLEVTAEPTPAKLADVVPVQPVPEPSQPAEPSQPVASEHDAVAATQNIAPTSTAAGQQMEAADTVASQQVAPPGSAEQQTVAGTEQAGRLAAESNTEMQPQIADVPVLPLSAGKPADGTAAADDMLMQVLTNMPLIAANIFAALLVVFLLTSWLGFNLPGFKGVFAEYKLNRLLRWRLSGRYQHFRKLKLFTAKDEVTEVDHLVLSPFGIFVIAVQSYRGHIYGTETQANWTRHYFGNKKQFMNPLHQNFKNMEAVKHLLQLQGSEASKHVHAVVAFSRVSQFETAMPANVTYVDAVSAYLKQFTEPCFTDEQQARYAALLSQASAEH